MILMLVASLGASAKQKIQVTDLKISGNFIYAHIDDFLTVTFNSKNKKSVVFASDRCIARDCIKKLNTKKSTLTFKKDFSLTNYLNKNYGNKQN